jgi:hypothetical protein
VFIGFSLEEWIINYMYYIKKMEDNEKKTAALATAKKKTILEPTLQVQSVNKKHVDSDSCVTELDPGFPPPIYKDSL